MLTAENRNAGAYSDDGVDLSLIRWMLTLTPAERLETAQQYVDFVVKVHGRNSQPLPDLDEVFDLETLIAVKEKAGGEKDRTVLPILRRTLEESRRRCASTPGPPPQRLD